MTNNDSFFYEYPLGYLISNKDKKSDLYQALRNTCDYLLDGHNPNESELRVSWNFFRMLFLVAIYLEDRLCWEILGAFTDHFNHSEKSPIEFMLWIFSDMINETIHTDWENIPTTPLEIPFFPNDKMGVEPRKKNKGRDKDKEIFFRDYVNQGGEQIPQPSREDMQAFAKATLQLIEEPKIKKALEEMSLGRFIDWFPKETQKTLARIGELTLREGETLLAAKPLIENFQGSFYSSQSAIIDQGTVQNGLSPKPELPKWKTVVPNKGDDWQILELWDNNHTNSEIGSRVHKEPRTITNRISTLRLRHPKAGILTDHERRKRFQKS
jgi:hypothetical protein